MKRLARRPAAVAAFAVIVAFIAIAAAAPHVAPFDPNATDFRAIRKAPSDLHRLGTDEVGRDVRQKFAATFTHSAMTQAYINALSTI